jgi:hypothetical protein
MAIPMPSGMPHREVHEDGERQPQAEHGGGQRPVPRETIPDAGSQWTSPNSW